MDKVLQKHHAVTALILAGGQGKRLQGRDKGLLEFQGKPFIEYLLDGIAPQVGSVLISANRNAQCYARYDYPVLADALGGYQGPLAGVATAMQRLDDGSNDLKNKKAAKVADAERFKAEKDKDIQGETEKSVKPAQYLITLPCDGPFVAPDYVDRMMMALSRSAAPLACAEYEGRIQPVYSLIRLSLKDDLNAYLASGQRKFTDWLMRNQAERVSFPAATMMFSTFNTPGELYKLKK